MYLLLIVSFIVLYIRYHRNSISNLLLTNFKSECLLNYNFEAFLFLYHKGQQLNEDGKLSFYSVLSYIGIFHILQYFTEKINTNTLEKCEECYYHIIRRPMNYALLGHNFHIIKYLISKGCKLLIYDVRFPLSNLFRKK